LIEDIDVSRCLLAKFADQSTISEICLFPSPVGVTGSDGQITLYGRTGHRPDGYHQGYCP